MAVPQVTVRALTSGPEHHWFGYYDKHQFDPADRCVLGMAVSFEHRSPRGDDEIAVGMVDLHDGGRWRELGRSKAWCWQQGCMLQWRPGCPDEAIWNDREGDRFVSRILNVRTGRLRTVGEPVYSISPDGRTAIAPDFRRINHLRPGYGYAGLDHPNRDVPAPDDVGIRRVDLDTGRSELLLSVAEVAAMPWRGGSLTGKMHWFNHLLFSPDGTRFIFLHRWRDPGSQANAFTTRMLTADRDGKNLHVVDDYGGMSHFIWRDPRHILAWSWQPKLDGGFYLYTDLSDEVTPVGRGVMTANGHCSYLPGGQWVLNDTYPWQKRQQELYLYHVPTGRRVCLGWFDAPAAYAGEWRCDLHPRSSRDGGLLTIDSAHGAGGRQIYLLDIRAILESR